MFSALPSPLIVPVGIAVGILISAPVGPVNVLCIHRAIQRGLLGGVAAGFGAVLGDGLIALMAALGVGAISGMVTKYRIIIQLIGGIVLLAFGLRLWFDTTHLNGPPAQSDRRPTLTEIVWDIPKTFILTVTNPGAVLGLIAIFGAVSSFVEIDGPIEALMLVASIMAGSLAWWTFLSVAASRVRDRIDGRRLHQINRVAGLLLISFALLLLGELSAKMLRLM